MLEMSFRFIRLQNEYDEDGEWISGGDVWDFAERK